ncbi:MAG: phospho-sugar mutase [Eubacteriales bacterium]|nr:phospho-sugar mutase [Eubacteriales bacterium]
MASYRTEYDRWLSSGLLDETQMAEMTEIRDKEDILKLRFGMKMDFGTAGLRSTMNMGPGCMNVFTVAQTTQAIAELIKSEGADARGVAIAYDSRNNSALFSATAAEVLAGNGIPAFLFDGIRPTPELSFAVRELGCIAGINITASHNPKEYNGYKAYWEDGAQISPEQAKAVSEAREKIDVLTGAKRMPLDAAVAAGIVHMLGEDFDEKYLAAVLATAIDPDGVAAIADTLKIVYTPLHGAGYRLVPEILHRLGLKHIYTVPEQMVLDGNFPTVKKPNPEYPDVFALGIAIADRVGSDLVVATDPDSDRIGVMARTKEGTFRTITGNQMGALLLDYIIRARRANGTLTKDDYAVKSIVSTDMAYRIAEVQGVKLYDVLTGFKFIGEVIKNYERAGKPGRFLLGFEESYGYLTGSYARDKDAVGAALMICEMTAFYSKQGLTLCDALEELYKTYGYYREGMTDIYMEGLDGIERRKRVMSTLRENPPKTIGGHKVARVGDFAARTYTDLATGEKTDSGLPASDVLVYILDDGDKVIVRPSGTEPKIKIYFLTHAENAAAAEPKLKAYMEDAQHFAEV